ncbi:hypothetical protein HK104_011138 [Borealophlyctis nickersoniae]|nr:hypothetical protein HK104_011138 [Borealophlyctis nickersoniae]
MSDRSPPNGDGGAPQTTLHFNRKLTRESKDNASGSATNKRKEKEKVSASRIDIDTSRIPTRSIGQDDDLRSLSSSLLGAEGLLVGVSDQTEMESNIMAQVDQALKKQEQAGDERRLAKIEGEIGAIKSKIRSMNDKLDQTATTLSEKKTLLSRVEKLEDQLQYATNQKKEILARMRNRGAGSHQQVGSSQGGGNLGETERERLIRTGKITPFAKLDGLERIVQRHGEESVDQPSISSVGSTSRSSTTKDITLHADESETIEADHDEEQIAQTRPFSIAPPLKRKRKIVDEDSEPEDDEDEDYVPEGGDEEDGEELEPDEVGGLVDDEDYRDIKGIQDDSAHAEHGRKKGRYKDVHVDDGDEKYYQKRLVNWAKTRRLRRLRNSGLPDLDDIDETQLEQNPENEMFEPSPKDDDAEYDGGYHIPGDVYCNLFDYQRTCTNWLWELHCQEVGGIIGDEMGLGKTIQIVAFLAGLGASNLLKGPIIVVCPATLLRQWVQEFHKWWPPFRVAILHASGSGLASSMPDGDGGDDDDDEEDGSSDLDEEFEDRRGDVRGGDRAWRGGKARKQPVKKKKKPLSKKGGKLNRKAKALVDRIVEKGHVLLTTYQGLRMHRSKLLPIKWSYCILDEGHRIRNPDADVTLTCKQLKTPHRIILSGTPIQNNLTELWSLFDFVFPGRLGTLPVFQSQFSIPITIGGYANATNVQVQTAYKCACVLRDLISPYLLRRIKADVAASLPKKSEQILFCRLTRAQILDYKDFLKSGEVASILDGSRHALYGIDILRKICNHPDLVRRKLAEHHPNYGLPDASGKMKVVQGLLTMWKSQGHKVLLFCQTRQMQDILEKFVRNEGYRYRRMDGATPIKNRIAMVDEFNENANLFLFLLTTKVGGLGINLTSANRIIIYDPDWNPSTDSQAQERAWRVGQKRPVTIYRLMTAGTIEEKIFHRQIFKTFLTNKILKDPRQRRFFKSNDLRDLFTFDDGSDDATGDGGTETGDLFFGSGAEVMLSDPSKSDGADGGTETGEGIKRSRADKGKGKALVAEDPAEELTAIGRINGLAKVEEYRAPPKPDAEAAQDSSDTDGNGEKSDGPTGDDDSRILAALFSSSGVHSALHHDVIMNSVSPEQVLVEKEASRVANEAISALKQSRRVVRAQVAREGVGVPTWTGSAGSAGAPQRRFGEKRIAGPIGNGGDRSSGGLMRSGTDEAGFGTGAASGFRSVSSPSLSRVNTPPAANTPPSSSSLLANLYKRSAIGGSTDATAPPTPPPSSTFPPTAQQTLIANIRDYLYFRGGKASTSEIVKEFKVKIGPDEVIVFRKMLKGIADFEKGGGVNGKGAWKLKDEFK